MPANYLHIWPRGQFMMIALPNQDKSFTVTLFMPTATFDTITDPASLRAFFSEYFPDSLDLIGRERLVKDYFSTKPAALVSVKCNPYHWSDKASWIALEFGAPSGSCLPESSCLEFPPGNSWDPVSREI